MITFSMTPEMISLTSTMTCLSAVDCRCATPKPRMKARTSAVITPITGGISMVKYGVSASPALWSCSTFPGSIRCGKIASPVK